MSVTASSKTYIASSLPLGGRVSIAIGLVATLAGCANPNVEHVARGSSKEHFSSAVYGTASPRMVADGEPIPRGGGQYLVGHPYTIAGRTYVPREPRPGYTQVGMASWYGDAFNGRRTANGEVYDMNSVSAAHPTMPLPSYARVTNLQNQRSIVVRVNDRGPYHASRVMDVSSRVADALDFKRYGTANVRVDYIGPAGLEGSDDRTLLATLRTDGRPATLDGMPATMVASNDVLQPPPPSLIPIFSFGPFGAPPPATTVVARAPAPAPEPADTRISPAVQTALIVPSRAVAPPIRVPLPPPRPFDLGTIPGAAVPLSTAPRFHQAAASFYESTNASALRLAPLPPFKHLDVRGLQPLGSQ